MIIQHVYYSKFVISNILFRKTCTVKASPNDKAMAKKETTEIEIVSMSVYMCNLSFLLKKNSTTMI